MAESSNAHADSRISSDLDPSSDDEDFISSASTTSVGTEERAMEKILSPHEMTAPSYSPELTASAEPLPSKINNRHGNNAELSEVSDLLKAKCKITDETSQVIEKKRLNLLDLPVDILQDIIKEVTHTNDLTSLALTCSALHSLAIPQMYSRFDIVWPETVQQAEHPAGVDALSFGLATLVMGEEIFRELPSGHSESCRHCGCTGSHTPPRYGPNDSRQIRRGNYFAQYTRKFSVGNGPADCVQDYCVTKETGKMLGTLVALAVARMINLETFIWDMPTGVVRDVWIALSSLATRPGHECRLENVWIRWHDNSEYIMRPLPGVPAISPITLPVTQTPNPPAVTTSSLQRKYGHVEYPTLSILPPLRSLSVLDIDEQSYLEEMAVLIERSRDRLRELRVGIALKVYLSEWVKPASNTDQPNSTTSNWPKAGGVLGTILGWSGRLQDKSFGEDSAQYNFQGASEDVEKSENKNTAISKTSSEEQQEQSSTDSTMEPNGVPEEESNFFSAPNEPLSVQLPDMKPSRESSKKPLKFAPFFTSHADRNLLKLEVLELERVSISAQVLLDTLDWTRITTLTILRCDGHEKLWRSLRRRFAPSPMPRIGVKHSKKNVNTHDRNSTEFPLRIKHIHTDAVSPYLLLFIKDTLCPDSLETLFLHGAPLHDSAVHIEAIYRNVIRTHRLSLRKLLIDSTERASGSSSRWRKWMFTRDIITFITSGRMPHLAELSMTLDSKDWHYFLQRLPYIPQIRALHIPHIGRPIHMDLKELALQVLDIVSLRPEIGLSYIGMHDKCYEILEGRNGESFDLSESDDNHSEGFVPGAENWPGSDTDGDDSDDDDDDNTVDSHSELSSDDRRSSDDEDSDFGSGRPNVSFRLREILFYDDKIAIFKARHGVL